ncbi:hypothetical protein PENANT_c005G02186 [Penicillium antarcticum]|uniref:Uncharacterized protein n=1 Tax=Penicillium antarcticum TaxID=416450 RepID=A0A1V6QEV9_9EURO|nr:uncharacterized protein N7508_007762 [Penicillium antarcticum]KAJ5297513.1 hypothetical protein N7508_007762 [Penicillium antarcticum]OQD87517.1 hypothetical protein PENANT_c005G02186 [Penicillium antarcticum]
MSCLSPPTDATTITSRPKLTLQTTALPRTFGSSTTGLSFSFAAAPTSSPTVRNTFKNAYDVASPSSATSSPVKSSRFNPKPTSPYVTHPNNVFNYRNPYQLPLGVRSILRNSPLDSASRRRGSISAGGNGHNAGTRRVFFPAKKQVSYRCPLEEEIRTERYTAQHLDLLRAETVQNEADKTPLETGPGPSPENEDEKNSDSDSSTSLSESASGDDTSADEGARDNNISLTKEERKKRRTLRIERQVRAVALLDGFEADPYAASTPQTPHQGRLKRRREWKWTLGPVGSDSNRADDSVQSLSPPSELGLSETSANSGHQ